MSEQDTYASHLGIDPERAERAIKSYDLRHSTGAEQERYESHFALKRPRNAADDSGRPGAAPAATVPLSAASLPAASAITPKPGRFSPRRHSVIDSTAVGILRSTLLPSFGIQSGLSLIAYAGSRATDRLDGKDWIWPTGQVANAWWSAVGSRVLCENLDVSTAFSTLEYPEKLILGGVTLWGGHLLYRVVSRSISRGADDPRYESAKAEPGFWNKALFSVFLPEAAFQTLISLPFTLPFRAQASLPASAELATGLGVFLFSSGFALEVLADMQLFEHKEKSSSLDTEGVWSIVRHPNYLGDALVHASFPLVLYGAGIMHPLAVLEPIANYILLRYVGGDKENEAFQEQRYFKEKSPKYSQLQEYKTRKNSFWPSVNEVHNPWVWTIVSVGVTCAMLERVFGRRRS